MAQTLLEPSGITKSLKEVQHEIERAEKDRDEIDRKLELRHAQVKVLQDLLQTVRGAQSKNQVSRRTQATKKKASTPRTGKGGTLTLSDMARQALAAIGQPAALPEIKQRMVKRFKLDPKRLVNLSQLMYKMRLRKMSFYKQGNKWGLLTWQPSKDKKPVRKAS